VPTASSTQVLKVPGVKQGSEIVSLPPEYPGGTVVVNFNRTNRQLTPIELRPPETFALGCPPGTGPAPATLAVALKVRVRVSGCILTL